MSDAHKLDGSPWKNRIVGHDNVPPDSLLANPHNFRIHPKPQQSALAGSLSELGWLQTVIVNQTTGHMLDGHLRVELALRNNEPTVPVTIVELTEAEEKLALATFDPITAMAAHDRDILESLLQDVQTADVDLLEMLDTMAIRAGIVPPPDPWEHWQGMPEFEHEDLTDGAAFTIRIFLKDETELEELGNLIGKDLKGRKFAWFSKQPIGDTYEAINGDGE